MQLKLIILSLLITGSTLTSSLSGQQTYTLLDCIDIALNNNLNIKQQQINNQQRNVAYSQARADLLPSVNANANQNFIFGRSIGLDNVYENTNSSQTNFGIGADITLFDGLRMKHNIDARRAEMHASEADLEKVQDDIIMAVSTAFLQALLNKELLAIAENQTITTKEDLKRRKNLVESGRMAQGELFEIEAQIAREELERIQAESNLKLALLDLAQIMELDSYNNFDIIAPPAEDLINETALLPSQTVYESALVNRPQIRSMKHRIESIEKEVLMTKAQYFPTLSFGANMGTGYYNMSGRNNDSFSSQLRNNMSNSIGFNLRIPIFNKLQIKNSVQNAQLNVMNTRLEMDKTKNELRKQIEQAYFNALGAESRWEAAKKSVAANNEAYRFVEEKHESGRANSYELFQAKNNQTRSLGEEAQAKFEYAFRLKILELLKD